MNSEAAKIGIFVVVAPFDIIFAAYLIVRCIVNQLLKPGLNKVTLFPSVLWKKKYDVTIK